ncbi:DNA mismatch repair endonuclease MutL [Fulvivirga sp. M361]|uniref:DNA mismatch repair endonuclease MutL n=1 Tax=Fulvivirga sp. M361 TaxID=2594266 RepID=UPI001179F2C7|nr:DNA mismatch repair endonuclease MutL [Fulvivirga sp. M361]TRX49825.1 DNA mismatch repair endonuclease MutL [Fulvivirga sp. M361]
MPDIIRLLPDSIANQIAAGEVVQRPASAVKELLENAVDAGAKKITVIIKDAGKELIRVIDDGKGMSETDARMSLERHATSKITRSEDLFSIKTMGFRGEALASIAAIAQVEIRTRPIGQELGTQIIVEASEVKKQELIACEEGTSIAVKNLFYNVPARRNFLKSNGVEMKHIIDEFQRVALSNPDIAFSLYQNDLESYNTSGGKLSQRIIHLFGKNYKEQLASCAEEIGDIKIHGYIGKPEFAKKTRGEQFFFVNHRFIKNNYLNHAILNAYEGLMQEGCFPFYVLFIDIDPRRVDVNVHPTKTEVKFDDERSVYSVVRAAVRQSLSSHNFTPALDFSADINLSQKLTAGRETIKDKNYSQFRNTPQTPQQQSNLENWEKLFDENKGKVSFDDFKEEEENLVLTFGSDLNKQEDVLEAELSHAIFQLHKKFIVTQVKSGMMLIGQEAAHERILFEKYLSYLDQKIGASQQSLFPQAITLNPGDYSLVMDMEEEIKALGFMIEPFGKSDILVKGMPADIAHLGERGVFEGLMEQFKKNKSELSIPKRENLARSLARRTSIKSGERLSEEEMRSLIDQLFACANPNYAPHGKTTFFILELTKIEDYFN